MEIKRESKKKNYVAFDEIKAGTVFELRDSMILMKMVENDETNAVDLEDGEQYFIEYDEPIVPVFATVTIKE
jgi:hypothetical protein